MYVVVWSLHERYAFRVPSPRECPSPQAYLSTHPLFAELCARGCRWKVFDTGAGAAAWPDPEAAHEG